MPDKLDKKCSNEWLREIVLPNRYGATRPCKIIEFKGKKFCLGGLSEVASVERFPGGLVAYEASRGSAFILLNCGDIYNHDLEDERLAFCRDKAVFYSDAGLSFFSDIGEIVCAFRDLNQYILGIEFENISEGKIEFSLGDDRKIRLTIDDLIEAIGSMVTSNLVYKGQ